MLLFYFLQQVRDCAYVLILDLAHVILPLHGHPQQAARVIAIDTSCVQIWHAKIRICRSAAD